MVVPECTFEVGEAVALQYGHGLSTAHCQLRLVKLVDLFFIVGEFLEASVSAEIVQSLLA